MEGWIKLHRKLSENPLWQCEKFTRGQAWVDLIMLTNHEENFFYKRGVKINVERGQCAWSELALSHRWQWSRSKVRKFLNELEKEQQIEQQKTNVTQIVRIINYDEYQQKDNKYNNKKTTKRQQKDTNKNDKNDKEIKIPIKKTWKNDFETYLQECRQAYAKFTKDEKEMELQRELNPGINVELSIKKGFTNYWGTEEGWNNKKEKGIEKINWKTTIKNSITHNTNKVYLTKR